MIVRALGVHGGVTPDMKTSSFYVNDELVIDAGSVATALSVEEQGRIDHIFISHPHLDHIKDLAFLADSVCGTRKTPVKVYSSPEVIGDLKNHFFNNVIWPDFTRIPDAVNPTVEFVSVPLGQVVKLSKTSIKMVEVNHPGNAVGFLISEPGCSIVISGDTGPTEELWAEARRAAEDPDRPLRAIVTEVSFPDRLQAVATAAGHFASSEFGREVREKFPRGIPIYLYHLKPPHWQEVMDEVLGLGIPEIRFIPSDHTFQFPALLKSSCSLSGKKKTRRAA